MNTLDPGYHEVLNALYMGTVPPHVTPPAVPRFRAESFRRRLQVSASTWEAFPRASFYATARLGDQALNGICQQLVRLSSSSTSLDGRLLTLIEEAARRWGAQVEEPWLQALFAYDQLVLRGAHYAGPDRERIRVLANLPEVFALATFDYDMIAFGQHIDLLVRNHAAPSLVAEYVPIRRRQRLAVLKTGTSQQFVVREVTNLLEALDGG